jgi:hypothetical protein
LVNTGWLLATFVPHSTIRSLSITSWSEQVLALTPIVAFMPSVLGAWQTRAAESTLATPMARAALPAT